MKHSITVQRLCLVLFALLLTAPALATDYGREGYEIFRSRYLGKHRKITTLNTVPVDITFSDCKTTGGTGSGAIFELEKGSEITVTAKHNYAIRWIILRDTEGGEDYDDKNGIKRIKSVSMGYDYYFEKKSISNSKISEGNKEQLNDDNNNIVVYNYDAPKQSVEINTHNNSKWGQFKVRDIIVGYVKIAKVKFSKGQYDVYSMSGEFTPVPNAGGHTGHVEYKLNNNDVADVLKNGKINVKRPGQGVFTATWHANEKYAKAETSTTINVKRDRVTFTPKNMSDVIFDNYNLREHLDKTTQSGRDFQWDNPQLSVTSSNPAVLSASKDGKLTFGGTAGEATITIKQEQNDRYEAASFSHTFIAVRGDQQSNTMYIRDPNDWKKFCGLVESGRTNLNAKMTGDVDLGTDITMLAYSKHYSGTFDGQGHTLTLNWDIGSNHWRAPFYYVEGGTIKNLRIKGTLTSNGKGLSGLIQNAYGTVTVSGCISDVNIKSIYNGGICEAAGLIQYIKDNAHVTIEDCIVKGTFNATEEGKKGMAGFVYSQRGHCTLNNCLYIGSGDGNEFSNTFAKNAKLNNCYYLNACGTAQGTQVTADQLKSGEVAYKLQNKRPKQAWGQILGTDNAPLPTADDAKHVYKVDFTYNNKVTATRYATKDKGFYGGLPALQELLGEDYNPHHYYSGFGFGGSFNASTRINADYNVPIIPTEKDYYEIASKEDWKKFCDLVNGGQNKLNGKLTKNIELIDDVWMAGTENHHYGGTFDGDGHSIYIKWNTRSQTFTALFRYVEDATFKNLHTAGTLVSTTNYLSGLICLLYNSATISNCTSNVIIMCTTVIQGNLYGMAGFISEAHGKGTITFNDCLVSGSVYVPDEAAKRGIDGFAGWMGEYSVFNNCLYIGENNANEAGATFTASGRTNNCYYLNPCGTAQGMQTTQITEAQLKSGEVAYLLQNGRSDQFWGQVLGTDEKPRPTTDAAKKVYKVAFAYNGEVKATRYANKGKGIHGALPTAQELLGSAYNAQNTYTLTFDGNFSASTTVSGDRTVDVTVTVVTGIDSVTNDAAGVNSPVYDLQGRRVADRFDAATRSQLPAGIYIVGGRKVIVK
ncbi:hypothetical protein [Hoylesella oralis]|uniref:hypothetical protein n=1 Tax=Hoylesella oralis TaxID=28134 RepID=UPI0003D2DF6B|nr:hypothetical protein HMPREF1199_01410 [Hoylesella oralis CC98A]